jgi:hypothetical protein
LREKQQGSKEQHGDDKGQQPEFFAFTKKNQEFM